MDINELKNLTPVTQEILQNIVKDLELEELFPGCAIRLRDTELVAEGWIDIYIPKGAAISSQTLFWAVCNKVLHYTEELGDYTVSRVPGYPILVNGRCHEAHYFKPGSYIWNKIQDSGLRLTFRFGATKKEVE